jgi:hypothetical protein
MPDNFPYPPGGTAVVGSVVAVGSIVCVGDGWIVAVGGTTVGTSVEGTKLAVAVGGNGWVEVGEAGSKVVVAVHVQVGVLTEDVLVGTLGTLSGLPTAIKVEFPIQFARCNSATVTR